MRGRMFLKVRSKRGASVEFLASILAQNLPAVVARTVSGGRACYEPDKDGNFEVRLLDSAYEGQLKKILDATSFEVLELQEVA